ncbi:MAG: hypothetical protein ACO294_11455 [Methylococcales bacterium]
MLNNIMRTSEIINEGLTHAELMQAYEQLQDLLGRTYHKHNKGSKPFKKSEIEPALQQARQLAKALGKFKPYGNRSSATLYNQIVIGLRAQLAKSGKPTFPDATSPRWFAAQMASYYNGYHRQVGARRWTRSTGGSYSDPSNYVVFDSEAKRDQAWADLQQRGKRVYIKDSSTPAPQTYVQMGKVLITPSTRTSNVFGSNPETAYALAVQSTSILRNSFRSKQDITDQQAAALQDIAATRTANTMDKINAILKMFRSEQEAKQAIAQSSKIDPRDRARLNAIIAGAANFKEP